MSLHCFDWDILDVESDDILCSASAVSPLGSSKAPGNDLADLCSRRVGALVQEHEAQPERIAAQGQHASKLASTDDADLHECG